MLRRPCEVCRMVSGATPISLPTLRTRSAGPWVCMFDREEGSLYALRMPVLDDCGGGVDEGAIHVEEEAVKRVPHGGLALLILL